MAQKKLEERMDFSDAEIESIKKEVQKLLAIEKNLAKLNQTSEETTKILASIAAEMAF